MSKIVIVLLAAILAVIVTPHVAVADEAGPDCESTQPWIGYAKTDPLRAAWYSLADSGHALNTCEGEHWDGNDTVSSANPSPNTDGCGPVPSGATVAWCMSADPNAGAPNSGNHPLGVRVSVSGTHAYVATDIYGVGRAATSDGVDGTKSTTAVYLRDNSDQLFGGTNVLAGVVSSAGLTQGTPGEQDCNQTEYQQGAYNGTRGCVRDNTAITAELDALKLLA